MSSLKAQLLKSGLADAKRAKKVHQQQLEAGKHHYCSNQTAYRNK